MIAWEKHSGGKHYQLRTAGRTQRLYTNGVFHSQYKPHMLLNGGVWDLLWLPLFFLPADKIRDVLVLGLGSGAAVAKIQRAFPAARICCVDIDRWHIHIARRFTRLDPHNLEIIHADALEYIQNVSPRRFDVIVDDLYAEVDGEPQRVIDFCEANKHWLRRLRKWLRPGGLLVANCLSRAQARQLLSARGLKPAFPGGFALRQAGFENVVAAVSDAPMDKKAFRSRLQAFAGCRYGAGCLRQLKAMRVDRLQAVREQGIQR